MDTITVVIKCAKTEEQRAALLKQVTLVERACHIGLSELEDRQLITAKYNALKQWLAKVDSRQEKAEAV